MKTKKVITMVLSAITVLMIIMSAAMKFMATEEIIKTMTKLGVAEYLPYLGIMELGFAFLFIFPKTMRLGVLLLSCYFAGAMATELSHGGPLLNAAIPLMLVWISAFLRDESVFLQKQTIRTQPQTF